MFKPRTQLLLLSLLLSAGAVFWSYQRMERARRAALGYEADWDVVHKKLAEIANPKNAESNIAAGRVDTELIRRLNNAVIIAGVKDNLVFTEPGVSTPAAPNSDYNEMTVFLRLDRISLQQLTVFFQQLAANDPSSRAKTIELATPDAALAPKTTNILPPNGREPWTADITIAYLLYAPKETKSR